MIHEEEEKEKDKSKYKIEYLGEKFSKDLRSHKIIIIGSYGVGKTTITNKIVYKEFEQEFIPTMDIKNSQIKVNDKIIQINIWDCCGNDKYALNIPNLYKNVSLAILVYAINDRKSYKELENLYAILKEHYLDTIIFLIGNKSDLEKEREVKIEDAEKFKNNYDDIN